MRTKEGYILRDVAGAPVVVATGEAAEQFLGMMSLNKTGAFFWSLLEKGTTEEELVEKALERYEVSEELLRQDVTGFLERLRQIGALE